MQSESLNCDSNFYLESGTTIMSVKATWIEGAQCIFPINE